MDAVQRFPDVARDKGVNEGKVPVDHTNRLGQIARKRPAAGVLQQTKRIELGGNRITVELEVGIRTTHSDVLVVARQRC